MDFYTVSVILLLLIPFGSASSPACSTDPASPKSDISINCGSLATSSAANGREWIGDNHPKIASLLKLEGTSTTSTSAKRLVSGADLVVHKTARISHSPFSYMFHLIKPGPKVLRLHFNPNPYKGFTSFQDFFTVEAAQFTLLENFSASLTSQALDLNFFTKEFYINIEQNQPLNIVFSPSITPHKTYAFINGIEIAVLPSHLTYFRGRDLEAHVVGRKSNVYVDNSSALELIHRLYVKQEPVLKEHEFDTFGMWSKVPKQKANGISKLTWTRLVNVGYKYLVRVHFTELGLKIARTGHVMFEVFMNGMIVDTSTDIVQERDGLMLQYRDYLVVMKGRKQDGQRKLLIALQHWNSMEAHGLLKGFEILKVSNTGNSLASPNPPYPESNVPPRMMMLKFLSPKVTIEICMMILVTLASIIAHQLRIITEHNYGDEGNKPSARAQQHCRRFPLAEIESATKSFSDALFLGKGGFGRVYKGQIDNGKLTVAIKRRSRLYSMQGSVEFWTEIETLSELRHINLVSLIGYCNDYREMILVYEYMRYGTLADHLHKLPQKNDNKSCLTWKQRLHICIGAGRGLDYLHTGHVIHRDVKTSNILLDENFIAKVSDFGLAKPVDRSKSLSHVSTNVKGTAGYCDPYYMNTRKLSRKSDTYAFGVVLLEVLCGKPAMDRHAEGDDCLLTKWAWNKLDKGEDFDIVDSSLIREISPHSLKAFIQVARSCLQEEPKKRPTMAQVVVQLEFALELQERTNASIRDRERRIADETKRQVGTKTVRQVHAVARPNVRKSSNEASTANDDQQQLQINTPVHLWPWFDLWNRIKPYNKKEIGPRTLPEICEAERNLRKFDFASITDATNQFSCSNKIGQGGFGSVYKAVLSTGQTLAVKRLSPGSVQGLTGFRNEILLSLNLHHCSIMNLHGYCILGDETMLVYEFMSKGSLDSHIYDEYRRRMLHWALRFKIIIGIANGIVYLHQESRMQIIHRDIKPSNILLDSEMNPKISDFGLAIIIKDDQTVLLETELAGTLGYLAPEVNTYRSVSTMSEVYSFGALILEVISGKKIMSHRHHLVKYAWELWNKGNAFDLVDESLNGSFSTEEALRCIQVGLLCTQKQPHHRPRIISVLKMLRGEESSVDLHEKVARAAIADDVKFDALGESYLLVDTENLSNDAEAEGVPGPPNSAMFVT